MKILNSKKYFLVMIFLLAITVIFSFFYIFTAKKLGLMNLDQVLLNHQIEKLKNNKFETIIIGDSTAGNAIDANYYSFLSLKKTGNLSLTGSFSEAGLAILEKSKKTRLKNVIIISGLDIWMREVGPGYKVFLNEFNNYNNIFYHYYKNLNLLDINIIRHLFIQKYILKKDIISIENDYIKQGKKLLKPENYYFYEKKINLEKFQILKDIFDYCDKEKLNCIHANGPVIKSYCQNKNFNSYIQAVHNKFKSLGINYSENIFCLEDEEYGDSIDHIANRKKQEFTKKYFFIFNKNLENSKDIK